ncbi:hypothetical protein KR009_011203 [Drosophila setifemur]|nr:hypothetical protein KR009_011203 [Drosophila setifemur]
MPFPLQLMLIAVMATTCVKAKPLVSFGVSYQQPYLGPATGPSYYNSYYGNPYQGGGYYYQNSPGPYRYPYTGNRYGALDVGIGALSLTPFLL